MAQLTAMRIIGLRVRKRRDVCQARVLEIVARHYEALRMIAGRRICQIALELAVLALQILDLDRERVDLLLKMGNLRPQS